MKRSLFIILLILLTHFVSGQGNIEYNLTVLDINKNPISGIKITAIETNSLTEVKATTNNNGGVYLKLNNGREWAVSIGEMKKEIYLNAMKFQLMKMNEEFIYDLESYKRQKMQVNDRTGIKYQVIEQNNDEKTDFNMPDCFLIANLKDPESMVLENVEIKLVSNTDSIIYKSKTDADGRAFFVLPNKRKYDIDVGECTNYSYADFGDEYKQMSVEIEYVPSLVHEKIRNDTIYQKLYANSTASSARALVIIKVTGGKQRGKEEAIFLRPLNSKKIYRAQTSKSGEAKFLLPIGHIYLVDFNHQKDADAINLSRASERTTASYDILYSPDPRLEFPERYIPTSDRLFLKEFNSFLTKQFEKPIKKPFILKVLSVLKINKKSKEALLKISLASSETYGGAMRIPLNIAFVLDKSGSMYSNQRTESLKRSLWELGNNLANIDNISIVLFNDYSLCVLESSTEHLEGIQKVIDNYDASGGTNIYEGLKKGVEYVQKNYNSKKSNRIILLTDGYGVTPPKQITDFVSKINNSGIEFSVIGLGTDFNQSLLKLIAEKGNGTFSFVDNSIKLSETFLSEVKSAFSYMASDVKVEVFHDEKLIFSNLLGYPVKKIMKNHFLFEISKLPQGENQLAFIKFKLDKPVKQIIEKPLKIKVSYFDLVKKVAVSYEEEVLLNWTDESGLELKLDQEEKKLYAIAILNQSLITMAEAYESKNIIAAKEALNSGIEQMKEIFPEAKPKEVESLLEEARKYLVLLNQIDQNK